MDYTIRRLKQEGTGTDLLRYIMWQRGIELVVLEIAMCAVIPCEVVSGKRRGR